MITPGKHLALCRLVASVPATERVPPSVQPARCAGCSRKVYASPGTRELMRRGAMEPVCIDCVPANVIPVPVPTSALAPGPKARDAERN
jgi:hypothetical protein